ncbi:flavoprotein [Streptomyces jumonjinensis]|uniref:flavoprotein n=1 Tax=Streptomyces jumonjinensis TaxID=1945 RepID=UPI0037B9A562
MTRCLYVIACAAPPARRLHIPIKAAQEAGWDVCAVLTPTAYRWAAEDPETPEGSLPALEALTGHPIRSQYKLPSQSDVLPDPDAMLVAPLTSNSLHKWATGASDTLALGLVTEALGFPEIPIVALPYWNAAQHQHPHRPAAVETLREAGVQLLLGEGGFVPHPARQGQLDAYPWHAALDALPTP